MANITCDVVKCVFNTHGGCSRDYIEVDENCEASNACETYCDSFSDKISDDKNRACTNGCPCSDAEIECDVTSCMYNENQYCNAENIHIGTAHAKTCCETECNTFKKKM